MEKDLKKIWHSARIYACKKGMDRYSEDFAQEACIAISRGRKSTMGQLYIDFLRKVGGDPRGRDNFQGNPIEGFNAISLDSIDGFHNLFASLCQDSDSDFYKMICRLKREKRAVIILRFKWGFTQAEMARLFGVSETLIAIWTQSAFCELKKSANLNASKEKRPKKLI